ncbi:hypothetical protein H072_8607 [Dactylellina haptotyla CBS 200.50]|uniref:Chromo domain-containing protein n=1 Tax=Dactylellina haptotyla (strain CBS 200.50) TaxID=1284197 RepID=S8A4Q2_DACHA|nr:hypothetical protein H072_8607 [Dactylellina haptotyla CBS 200.50]
MARRTQIPQSQAPYRPGHRTAATNASAAAEPHELREKSPVNYENPTTQETSSPKSSSDAGGQWWEVRRIVAERGTGKRQLYQIEWEGTDEHGQPWPLDWKKPHEVTTELISHWEARKRRKRQRSISSSPPPPQPRQAGVSKPVPIATQELGRYKCGSKRLKTPKSEPIIITSSQEGEEENEDITPPQEGICSVGSIDDSIPIKSRSRPNRRQIIGSSQSIGNHSIAKVERRLLDDEEGERERDEELEELEAGQEEEEEEAALEELQETENNLENISNSPPLKQTDFAVEITLPTVLQRAEYIVYQTPELSPDLGEIEEDGEGDEAVQDEEEGEKDKGAPRRNTEPIQEPVGAVPGAEDAGPLETPDIFGVSSGESISDDPEIQVPLTQNSRRERKEVPDSQSPTATPLTITPNNQQLVPETPLNNLVTVSPVNDHLQIIQEIFTSDGIENNDSSQLDVQNDYVDIPDSSNRVFAQDVREMKYQEAQSQSASDNSKNSQNFQNTNRSQNSQNSQNSIPSAQPSFGKIGATPSFQSFSNKESGVHPASAVSGASHEASAESGRAAKCVVGEAAPSPCSDQQLDESQTPRSPQPNVSRSNQESATATDSSFVTPKSVLESLRVADATGVIASLPLESHPAPQRLNSDTVRILQLAVESRLTGILEAPNESPTPSAQPENLQSQDRGEGEVIESVDSSSLRNLQPYEPASFGTNFETFPSLLSPKTPVKEDPLQDRSAASTPCGPIPASVQPAPVTVLGYFPSQRSSQQAAQNEDNITQSSTALQQAVSSQPRENTSPSPSRETRASRKRRLNNSLSEDEIMSAAPASPLLNVSDMASAPDHCLSPKRQGMVTRSSGLLSSSQPPASTAEELEVDGHQREELTPTPEDSTSIDDEYLAASQALNLLQAPVQSTSSEIFLAIPLNDNQIKLYQEKLRSSYRDFEAFVGIQNTQLHGPSASSPVEAMESLVHKLDAIASHCDLFDDHPYTVPGPKIAGWFCKQSSKFALLSNLFEKLKHETYNISIVAEDGLLMDYLEIFMKSKELRHRRYRSDMQSASERTDENSQGLSIILVPSKVDRSVTLPPVNLIIGIDSTLDPSAAHIQELRKNESGTPTPIVHLIGINTVAHILLCLPNSIKTDRQNYIHPVLFAAYLIREDVGILPKNLLDHLDALSIGSPLSWLEKLQTTQEKLLPPLRYDSQNTQTGRVAVPTPVSPARKRVLSLSVAPVDPSGKHKKARIDHSQVSPRTSGDTPMANYGGEIGNSDNSENINKEEHTTEIVGATVGEDPLGAAPNTEPNDITHVTGTIPSGSKPEEPSAPVEPVREEAEDNIDAILEEVEAKAEVDAEEELEDDSEEEESEEVILSAMSKEDMITLLRSYQAELLQRRDHADEWERHLSDREVDYQEQREKIRNLKQELRRQEEQITALTKQRDRSKAATETAVQESNQLRDDLDRFKQALLDTPEGDATRTKIMFDNMDLNTKVITLERKRKSLEKELEFAREQYQIATQGTSVLIKEKSDLEEENELLRIQADDIKVKLKQLNLDKERTKYQNQIRELRARLDRAHRQIFTLETEKKRVERTRGLQTRASSIPPRAAQSSPAPTPTRPVSPSQANHRHLLRGMDGP